MMWIVFAVGFSAGFIVAALMLPLFITSKRKD